MNSIDKGGSRAPSSESKRPVSKPSSTSSSGSSSSSGGSSSTGSTRSIRSNTASNRPAEGTGLDVAAKKKTNEVRAASAVQATPSGATDAEIAAQVRDDVRAASAGGADAAQIMTVAHQRAVELVRDRYPDMPPTERMDRAMAIATYVLNGPGQIENLTKVDSGETRTVEYMRDIAANDPQGALFAGMDLDSNNGGGTLYDSYNDGTPNQAFHTNFFIAAGYVAGGDMTKAALAQGGNVYHETVDPDAWANGGGSMADYAASASGIIAGHQLFEARKYAAGFESGAHAEGGNIDLLVPTMVSGFVSDAGTPAPHVAGTTDAQQQGADQMMGQIADYRSGWLYQLATEKNPVAGLLVSFFGAAPWLRGLSPSPSR